MFPIFAPPPVCLAFLFRYGFRERSKVLVPTVDTTRYTFLLDRIVRVRAPVLFCGESGTAKTVTIQNFFESLDLDFYQVTSLHQSLAFRNQHSFPMHT